MGWYYNALCERNGDTDPARIVIGKDTRRSSYMFEYSLVAGLTASGADASIGKEIARIEAKKVKAETKAAESAKKAEAEDVLKKLLASGVSADEILAKLK